jgi:hypothetical protein
MVSFQFTVKNVFNEIEEEKILELSLIANPNSLLHLRSYLGLGDKKHFSKEILQLKKICCFKDVFNKITIKCYCKIKSTIKFEVTKNMIIFYEVFQIIRKFFFY